MVPRSFSFIKVLSVKMSSVSNVSYVPAAVRGMKQLDREKFLRNVEVPVLKLSSDIVSKVLRICKPYILKFDNFKPVQTIEDKSFSRCIFLDLEKFKTWKEISADLQKSLEQHNVSESNFETKEIQLSYDNFRYNDIFKAVLPEGEEIVSGFSQIGHIIHLNLREHLLDYKTLIGEVLIDKIKSCRTVVNKTNMIDNTYRNFQMELIAGDEDFLVTVKENTCSFQFDFSKVYWNPRLCKEHERILGFLKPGDVLFDVFCGVGPFAIPAAKRKCRVFANDLNPDSYNWLNHNAKHNKIKTQHFQSYNIDGKDFICDNFKKFIVDCCKGNEKLGDGAKVYVTMNLPAMAVEFLKYFVGLVKDEDLADKINFDIIVFVYCFAVGDDSDTVARQMVNDNMGCDVTPYILNVFNVRNVSPKKEMMRVTLKLNKKLLCGESVYNSEPPLKKKCIENNADE